MARVAIQFAMPRWQCESGLRAVVKQHRFPIEGVVTTSAVRAKAPFMRIVRLMTGIAVAATGDGKIVGTMTRLAVKTFVSADEGKPRDHHVVKR